MPGWKLAAPNGRFWLGGALLQEVTSPTRVIIGPRGGRRPAPSTRADAIFADSKRSRLICYEIKVSRADLVHELANPAKAEEWGQYCNEFWLVCPARVLTPELMQRLPPTWGVYTEPSGRRRFSLTPVRPAVEATPDGACAVNGWARVVGHMAWRDAQRSPALELVRNDFPDEEEEAA